MEYIYKFVFSFHQVGTKSNTKGPRNNATLLHSVSYSRLKPSPLDPFLGIRIYEALQKQNLRHTDSSLHLCFSFYHQSSGVEKEKDDVTVAHIYIYILCVYRSCKNTEHSVDEKENMGVGGTSGENERSGI